VDHATAARIDSVVAVTGITNDQLCARNHLLDRRRSHTSHESLEANIIEIEASTEDGAMIERACADFCAFALPQRLGYGSQ
jgi:hypothetical protein